MRYSTFASLLPVLGSVAYAAPSMGMSSESSCQPCDGKMRRTDSVKCCASSENAMAGDSMSSASMMAESTSSAMMAEATTMMMAGESSMMAEATTMMMAGEGSMTTSAMMAEETMAGEGGCGSGGCGGGGETTIVHATTITSAMSSYETPMYGSGSSSWGSDLNSCMQMCQMQFGMGSGSGGEMAPPTETSSTATATHTIIVAPTQGVLRYVPFAVEANPGDALEFVWGAGPHTVTLSDGNNVCNRSTTDKAFDSGKLNATATFQASVVGDLSTPQFHYCTVMTHCQKGMFGIVNPPMSNVSNALTDSATKTTAEQPSGTADVSQIKASDASCSSMECWVSTWSSSSPEASTSARVVKKACESTPGSWEWGNNWDMSSMLSTDITKETIIQNMMYSRLMISMNPSMLVPGSSMSNFTAAPELSDFVALNANTTESAGDGGFSGVSTVAPVTASSAASSSANAEAANSTGKTTSGAGRTAATSGAVLALAGVLVAVSL